MYICCYCIERTYYLDYFPPYNTAHFVVSQYDRRGNVGVLKSRFTHISSFDDMCHFTTCHKLPCNMSCSGGTL